MQSLSLSPVITVLNDSLTANYNTNDGRHLNGGDISVVVIYFALVLATGFYAMYKSNRGTISGYFLAGRYMVWLPVGASVFASNIGSEHFIGLAGSGAASGLGVGAFEFNVNLYSGGIFIQQALGWDLYFSVILLLVITSICTVTGIIEVGGLGGLRDKYLKAIPASIPSHKYECAIPKEHSFQMLRPLDDPDMPWLGFILGQTPASIWYWCADQMMVQRLLAAKSLSHAQGGTLFAGFLKIFPLFLIIIPGMISRVLYTEEVACVDPNKCMQYCNSPVSCYNTAY
ncbi:unnamed protein product, partial [Medioppia subpectinata]